MPELPDIAIYLEALAPRIVGQPLERARTPGVPVPMTARLAAVAVSLCMCAVPLSAQGLSAYERDRGLAMLRTGRKDLEEHYYDTTFRGVNLTTHWDSAETLVRRAESNSQVFAVIAWALMGLEDSHTRFWPPERVDRVEYGWHLEMVGDTCFVVDANPDIDAAPDRPSPGDEVLKVGPFVPNRREFWKIGYWFQSISPQGVVPFTVRSPHGVVRQVQSRAKVTSGKQIMDLTHGDDIWDLIRREQNQERELKFRFVEYEKRALVWQMPTFVVEDRDIDKAIGKASNFPALVLDLRGNSGGLEDELLRLLGSFVDHTDTIGTIQRRHERKPFVVQPRKPFTGKLVVLVDSRSASAAEIFAAAIQLRKRGAVLGDRTRGAVMRSMIYSHQVGMDRVVFYRFSISDAAITMADGSRLEDTGMTPAELMLPTAADLAAGRDPVLAHALALVNVEMSPEEAGRLFPKER